MDIKILIAGGAALAAMASTAGMAQARVAEGHYAASAIEAGELVEAERVLRPESRADAADPARLINIATVYARTQRQAEARAALGYVARLPAERLDLANGESSSSHAIAQMMLARLDAR